MSEALPTPTSIDRAIARLFPDVLLFATTTLWPLTALMMMVNGGKLTVYGPGSRFGWLHDELGLTPAVPNTQAATHGEAVSFEFILKPDPDWLIVLDRDAAVGQAGTSARQVLDNDLIAATKAAKSGRIVYVDPARWYIVGGGGAAFTTIVQDMASALEAKPQP